MTAKPMLYPYLTFNGKTAEAMKFYHSVLGGELTMQTFGESKMGKTQAEKSRIIHATLQNDALTFMASDSMMGSPAKFGDNISMSIAGTTANGSQESSGSSRREGQWTCRWPSSSGETPSGCSPTSSASTG